MIRVCEVLMQSCPQRNCVETWRVSKRKCREIGVLPSMMWKRSIVQAAADNVRVTTTLTVLLVLLACACENEAAELVIEIPGSGADEESGGGEYRLDYSPPEGSPEPNHRVPAAASTINFRGLPGTKYHFMLYYSNATFHNLLTWNQTIITAPEPPTNLTVTLGRNKQATISWAPPANGGYTGFRFKVIPLTERAEGGARNITIEGSGNWTYALRDLSPGATYQLHAFTLLHDKESVAYASRNFTTKPNTPGKFIVWFRNETTLLVLWQPPYPPGAYTHYKVSIEPPDARDSELYVEKEGEPPGPAQAAFKGLVPGRAYNISVQTVSEPQISAPTTAQYRTVPLRPRNVTAPRQDLHETAFRVTWLPPLDLSEFEKYQVTVSGGGGAGGGGVAARRLTPVVRSRNETPSCWFEGLEPGAHYTVTVKTMSGKVTSWPATAELTLKPLPVRALQWRPADAGALLRWQPAEDSLQDEYKVSYHEAGPSRDDSSTLTTTSTNVTLDALLPGRNYTITVTAVSRGVESNESSVWARTKPLAPSVESAGAAGPAALRLTWRSDVNSRQDSYRLRYRRAGTDRYETLTTRDTTCTLENLFPGAVYEIQIAALSHDLLSDPQTLFKPVRPLPARELTVSRVTSNSALARWLGPDPAAGALGGYVLRYRTLSDSRWTTLDPLSPETTSAEITNMTHGERYVIELDTGSEAGPGGAGALSESVLSGQPLTAYHTVRANPVSNVAPLVDTRNMTIEWPRPKGRVEWYSLRWWATDRDAGSDPAPHEVRVGGGSGPTVRALIDGLDPGSGYAITIAAHSYNLTSDNFTMEIRTRPVIQSDMNIANEPSDSDGDDDGSAPRRHQPGIIVVYTPTPESASRFDEYRFRLEGANSEPRSASRPAHPADPAASQNVAFTDLVPGRLYNITMWTVSHNVTSHPVQRQTRLPPRPITRLNATKISAREITLEWDRPAGDYTDFEVQYLAAADRLQTHTTDELTIVVHSLKPYTNYTFTVLVRSGTVDTLRTVSRSRSVELVTHEAPPPAPRDLHLEDATPSRLSFVWELPPADANGVLRRFVLEYSPRDRPGARRNLTFPAEARAGHVDGLAPGGTYEFWLHAETGAGAGESAYWMQHMAIAAPPRPANDSLPVAVRRSTTTVVVRFFADYFSPANGNVTAYTLVVCEEQRNDTSACLPSWRDVHRLPVWPPYQVTKPYFPFHASQVEEFTIGSERCEGDSNAYCNGPLKPGTRYYVKLRAFTDPDKFTDTAYSLIYTEVDNTPWIIGASAGAAVLVGGVLVAVAVQRGVRGAEARRARAAVHGGRPAGEPAEEPVHEHPAVRPLALQAAARRRRGGLRLHQRELRARAQLAPGVHRDAGPAAQHARRLLAHVLGERLARHRDADAVRREGPREVRPVLAVRHAARLLRRHRRHRAQREPLPGLDRHRADGVPRRRAARAQALPLHHLAGLRRAGPADDARSVRARVPRPLPAGLAARRGALQRRRRPLRHLHHARHGAAAARRPRRLHRHIRDGVRDAPRAGLDGADGAAVHLHPPVPRRRARGPGPRAAAPQQPPAPAPPQPRLRRRRRHCGNGNVSARVRTKRYGATGPPGVMSSEYPPSIETILFAL